MLLLLRVLRPLLGMLFATAVSCRRATTNLFEQTTESVLFDLLSVFGSRVEGGMRHLLAALLCVDALLDDALVDASSTRFSTRRFARGVVWRKWGRDKGVLNKIDFA